MSLKYLIVEDSSKIRESLCDFFVAKSNGDISFDQAPTGDKGLELITKNSYDLVFLDVMLPGVSGFELCKAIRKNSVCPIIFITALGSEDSVLKGYELGGDDYVTKPFSLKELYAKSEALIRRYKGFTKKLPLTVGNIKMDVLSMQVFVEGKEIELPPKEYFILKLFMENKECVFSRQSILDHVWGLEFDGNDRLVDSQIKKLRKNLGNSGKQIKTIIGGGYKLTEKAGL